MVCKYVKHGKDNGTLGPQSMITDPQFHSLRKQISRHRGYEVVVRLKCIVSLSPEPSVLIRREDTTSF